MFNLYVPLPNIQYKVFEENHRCIQVAKTPKLIPREKHISIRYHNFSSYVKNGHIEILPIDTREYTANIFTKPLKDDALYLYLRLKLSGW